MKTLEVYDPAMCCSTGVCGPSVDPRIVNLAADLAFLKGLDINVDRFNLGHQPEAFIQNPLVTAEMGDEAEYLPIFIVNGRIMSKGCYPDRRQIASWFDIDVDVLPTKGLISLKVATTQNCCNEEGCC